MQQLPADWTTIQGHLEGIPGLDAKALAQLKAYYEGGEAKKGIHFFVVQYAAGEVIMAKGTTSDYAAVHLQGCVRVRDVVPTYRTSGRGCWDEPLARCLDSLVLRQAATWPKDAPVRRGWLGWLWPIYRLAPGLPLRINDFCEMWLAPTSAERWRNHVARALHGRLPSVRRLERELSDPNTAFANMGTQESQQHVLPITIRDAAGKIKPLEERFMGTTGTLWNQPRSVTLVADNDPDDGGKPCVMLLIKRKVLEEIIKKSPKFYEQKMTEFVRTTLPDVLAKNRLFRDRLFVEDVRDWPALVPALQGKTAADRAQHLIAQLARSVPWLARADAHHLDSHEKSQIIERLNQALTSREFIEPEFEAATDAGDELGELWGRRARLNDCEVVRLNRLILEDALPGVFASGARPFPLTRADFRAFTVALTTAHQEKFGKMLQPDRLENKDKKSVKKGVPVFKQGDPADSVYLILSGMVRVSMDLAGGQSMVNNLETDAYFGESAALVATAEGQPPPVRSAAVETLCSTTLLRIDRDVLRTLFDGPYRALGDKLRRERGLLSVRDEQMRAGRLLPPQEPPLALAEKLVLTRNLLLIDMNKCTRCDQCVRGCAEAHDGVPRFHRANPQMRFGKWEAAAACLHCLDAPCQQACPVGAITWLENQAVQIHRDRCIGCSQCASECPFGVIDMYEPFSPKDAPSSKKGIVANKCDLCLTDEHDPPCVACCPYDAAKRVDPLAHFPELKSWANFTSRG